MNFLVGLTGIALSLAMIKYRSKIADMVGSADWMMKLGGVYNVILLAAFAIFIFSVATVTGTTDVFLAPILWILPLPESPETPTF